MTEFTDHYVNNRDFTEAVAKYAKKAREAQQAGEQLPQMSDYIGTCIMKIAQRLATKPNFSGYSYKEEMINDGIENVLLYLKNFDAEKIRAQDKTPNAFAYVTQIIYFAFLRRIEKEKKQQNIKEKQIEVAGLFEDIVNQQGHDSQQYPNKYLQLIQNNVDQRNEEKEQSKDKTTVKKRPRYQDENKDSK